LLRCCSAGVFKLARSAETSWRRLDGATRLGRPIAGVRCRDGEAVTNPEEQAAARRPTPGSTIARLARGLPDTDDRFTVSKIDSGVAMATNVHLTSELERFAGAWVEGGRFNNVSEVVRTALRLLQEAEERRDRFEAMLRAVEDETDRDGGHALDEVVAVVDAVLAQKP
jgi:antitoxin ParD1/3/4